MVTREREKKRGRAAHSARESRVAQAALLTLLTALLLRERTEQSRTESAN